MAKGTKLGPRAIVAVGKNSKGKAIYSYMLKRTAENFGFQIQKTIPTVKSKKGINVPRRGSKSGANAIMVPKGKNDKTSKGNVKMVRIPMPGSMTIPKIQAFLQKAGKNKPEYFVTSDGRTYPVTN